MTTNEPARSIERSRLDHLVGGLLVGAYRIDEIPAVDDPALAQIVAGVKGAHAYLNEWPVPLVDTINYLVARLGADPFEASAHVRCLAIAWADRETRARRGAVLSVALQGYERCNELLEEEIDRLVAQIERVERAREQAKRWGVLVDDAALSFARAQDEAEAA